MMLDVLGDVRYFKPRTRVIEQENLQKTYLNLFEWNDSTRLVPCALRSRGPSTSGGWIAPASMYIHIYIYS